MNPWLRGFLAVLAGFVVAFLVIWLVEAINGHVLYPDLAKQAQGVTNIEDMRTLMAGAPPGSLLVVLVGWTLGSLTGGLVATSIGRRPPYRHAIYLGLLVTLCALANNMMLPPPAWFLVAGVLVPIPAACAGARFAPAGAV